MLTDFKAFILRGNVVHLAVGVVIGASGLGARSDPRHGRLPALPEHHSEARNGL